MFVMAVEANNTPLKRCSVCSEEKPATTEFFHPNKGGKYGLRGQCIPCRREVVRRNIAEPHNAKRRKEYHDAAVASGKYAEWKRAWREANLEKERESARKHRAKFRDRYREYNQIWRDENRDKVRAKQRRAEANLRQSPSHVLKCRVRKRLRAMLGGQIDNRRTEALLGYTRDDLVRHIERQFSKGMTWDALLRGEIHIDHIIPVASFNITGTDCPEFKACWALTNLRPLWAADNQAKGAKVLTLL